MAAPAQIISSIQTWSILWQTVPRGTKMSHHLWHLLGGSTTNILRVSWHSCQRQETHDALAETFCIIINLFFIIYMKEILMPGVASCFSVKDANNVSSQLCGTLVWLSTYHHGVTQTNPPPKLQFTTSNTIPDVNWELLALLAALKRSKSHSERTQWGKLLTKAHMHWGSLEYCFGDILWGKNLPW